MGCICAIKTINGYKCNITEEKCNFDIPDSKRCAEEYDEGPDSLSEEDLLQDEVYDDNISE